MSGLVLYLGLVVLFVWRFLSGWRLCGAWMEYANYCMWPGKAPPLRWIFGVRTWMTPTQKFFTVFYGFLGILVLQPPKIPGCAFQAPLHVATGLERLCHLLLRHAGHATWRRFVGRCWRCWGQWLETREEWHTLFGSIVECFYCYCFDLWLLVLFIFFNRMFFDAYLEYLECSETPALLDSTMLMSHISIWHMAGEQVFASLPHWMKPLMCFDEKLLAVRCFSKLEQVPTSTWEISEPWVKIQIYSNNLADALTGFCGLGTPFWPQNAIWSNW